MQIKPKVFTYKTTIHWSGEKRGVLACEGKPDLEVSSPPEFKGHAGFWTPEDLLVAAVNSCTMMTFLSAAARETIAIVSYESDATGTLETAEDGVFRFTRVVLRPRIVLARQEDRERAHAAFKKAEASCLVTSSLLTEVEGEPRIEVRA